METSDNQLLIKISEEFVKGNIGFVDPYLAADVKWKVLGEDSILGKEAVLDASKMVQLESFPVITVNNIVAENNFVVIESTGKAKTQKGKPYNQTYCDIFRFNAGKLKEITTYLDTALSNEVQND